MEIKKKCPICNGIISIDTTDMEHNDIKIIECIICGENIIVECNKKGIK